MTLRYPERPSVDAVEDLAGVQAADPYRWLEDGTSNEVRQWQEVHNEVATATVRGLDIDDPDEVRRLRTFSPYHLIEDREYPAVFVDAGDTDPRCPGSEQSSEWLAFVFDRPGIPG